MEDIGSRDEKSRVGPMHMLCADRHSASLGECDGNPYTFTMKKCSQLTIQLLYTQYISCSLHVPED